MLRVSLDPPLNLVASSNKVAVREHAPMLSPWAGAVGIAGVGPEDSLQVGQCLGQGLL